MCARAFRKPSLRPPVDLSVGVVRRRCDCVCGAPTRMRTVSFERAPFGVRHLAHVKPILDRGRRLERVTFQTTTACRDCKITFYLRSSAVRSVRSMGRHFSVCSNWFTP